MKNNRGETLVEVLASVLVVSLGSTLLASMIVSSARIINTSNTAIAEFYDNTSAMLKELNRGSSGSGTAAGQMKFDLSSGGHIESFCGETTDLLIGQNDPAGSSGNYAYSVSAYRMKP